MAVAILSLSSIHKNLKLCSLRLSLQICPESVSCQDLARVTKMADLHEFQYLARRILFKDDIVTLREDDVRDPEGRVFHRKVIEYKKAAAVLPIAADGRVLLIRQYRHPVGKMLWDLPGGMIEDGEDPKSAAARELVEETGHVVEQLDFLLRFHPEPALADHEIYLFRADVVVNSPKHNFVAESEIRQIAFFTIAEAMKKIHTGEIASSWTVVGLLLLWGSTHHDQGGGAGNCVSW